MPCYLSSRDRIRYGGSITNICLINLFKYKWMISRNAESIDINSKIKQKTKDLNYWYLLINIHEALKAKVHPNAEGCLAVSLIFMSLLYNSRVHTVCITLWNNRHASTSIAISRSFSSYQIDKPYFKLTLACCLCWNTQIYWESDRLLCWQFKPAILTHWGWISEVC